MFSLQRKLSGGCWHPAQHFLDGDLLVGDKMSPGHMTCLCFAHSHCLLKIFKWRGESGRLCALVRPHAITDARLPAPGEMFAHPEGSSDGTVPVLGLMEEPPQYLFTQLMCSLENLGNKGEQLLTTAGLAVLKEIEEIM